MKFSNFFDKDFFRYFVLFTEIGVTIVLNILLAIYFYNLFEKYFFKSFKRKSSFSHLDFILENSISNPCLTLTTSSFL